jgi:hypothetical protein
MDKEKSESPQTGKIIEKNISHRMPFAAGKYYMRCLLEVSSITWQNVFESEMTG